MQRRPAQYVVYLFLLCSLMLPLLWEIAHRSAFGQPFAQTSPPDPRFGMVEAFWDPSAAAEGGVAWERILFQWSQLQPNGPDDWNTLHVPDEWLQSAQAQGREVVGLLKNTPYWATDADPPMEASPPRGLDLPVDDPGNTWAAFVRRAVTFFGARGVHRWVIWNEPDISPGVYGQEWAGTAEEYHRLLKVAYLVIKQVDPGAQVHLAGLTHWHDPRWLRNFLALATADPEGAAHGYFFDVVSLHIYFQTDSVDYIVNETRSALSAYGLTKSIWINETNASPDSDPQWPIVRPRWRVDLTEQASFILQSFALGLAAGAERIAVYRLMDAGLAPGGEPFGLLRPDHTRRPAYTAYQLVTRHYAGTQAARISRQPLFTQVTLGRGAWTTRVLWARTAAQVSVSLPALAAQATLVDQAGNAQALDGSAGSHVLTLPGARCADEVLGCIIGGPTFLLIEEATSPDVGAPPVVATSTAGVPVSEDTPAAEASPTIVVDATAVVTATQALTVSATPVVTITVPLTVTVGATPTLAPAPSATASATATLTPVPSDTPAPVPTLTVPPSPTSSPTRTATVVPASPSAGATSSPAPTLAPVTETTAPGDAALIVFSASVLLAGLLGFVLARARQRARRGGPE